MRPHKWIGAVGVEDCTFKRCTFERIGVLTNADSQDAMRIAAGALE